MEAKPLDADAELAAFKAMIEQNSIGLTNELLDTVAAWLRSVKPNADAWLAVVNEQLKREASNLARMGWRDFALVYLVHRASCFQNRSEKQGTERIGDCPRSRLTNLKATDHGLADVIRLDRKHVKHALALLAQWKLTRKVANKKPKQAERWAVLTDKPWLQAAPLSVVGDAKAA